MEINKCYRVYEYKRVMDNRDHRALNPVEFPSRKLDRFQTEDDAIKALIDDGFTYQDYVILREVYITR